MSGTPSYALLSSMLGLRGMLDEPVDALAEFRVDLWLETGTGIPVGKDPALAFCSLSRQAVVPSSFRIRGSRCF